ncbi:hypothetical protein INE81_03407 [Bacteroides salyersiae]|uniref:hypothetical protein n=1 Tax=Bacteroides salyersiae TaxID=291644 RepID=UPI001B8C8E19|nr:hypothetical protein [Bacteroides salyersiae]MCS2403773.1 hypothetical protein [Bacteroides salyersiae]QUT76920.1 hypothetical protein INE81_03407 [Bacteroides salyersiae]
MKKITILSFLSLAISVLALGLSICEHRDLCIDMASFLVGIVSISVAVLAILQAINYFIFEDRIHKKIKAIEDKNEEVIKAMRYDYDQCITGVIISTETLDYYRRNIYDKAFDNFIEALAHVNNSSIKYSQDFIIEYINRIVEDEKKYEVPTIKLSEFEKKSAIDIISKVDNIHKANIISFIEGLK